MRLADRIDSVRAVVKPSGKVTHGDANAILSDCKAAADGPTTGDKAVLFMTFAVIGWLLADMIGGWL